jgi:hypothetical protein
MAASDDAFCQWAGLALVKGLLAVGSRPRRQKGSVLAGFWLCGSGWVVWLRPGGAAKKPVNNF